MVIRFIINMLQRLTGRSPKLFRGIKYLSYGTAIVCAGVLYMSEHGVITLSPLVYQIAYGLFYSGIGSGTTASATTKDPALIGSDVKQAINEDKRLY